jgi:putative peptidoglycan lipid II flippase
VRPDLPRPLDRVVRRALAPDPAERFEDAPSFATALRALDASEGGEDVPRRRLVGTWLGVPIAIVAAAAAIILAGLWLGRLEVGGPLGIRAAEEAPRAPEAPVTRVLRPVSVQVLDPPPGDGSENDSTATLAMDGDPETAWRSENYFDARLNKPGVGLVFDLGERRDVVGFRLSTPHPGFVFQLSVGDDPATLLGGVGEPYTAETETRGALEGSGRYVLVWVSTVVPVEDGNRAEIGELRMVVLDDA